MAIRLKKLCRWASLILFLSILGIFSFYIVLPKWWLSVSITDYKEWHPIYGKWLFVLFRRVLPLLFISNFLLLILINYKVIKKFVREVMVKMCAILKNLIQSATADYLSERRFIASLFFSLISLIYAIAYSSILWQIEIVTPTGLIPFKEFAEVTYFKEGAISLFVYPSVFWISQTSWFIHLILITAIIISLYGIFFKMKLYGYVFLWFTYISFVNFGRDLFHFPWDTFLCEVGFLTVLGVYFIRHRGFMPGIILGLFLALFFRQWFSMALVKILWEADYSWYNLTFMKFYWLNQPSPTPIAAVLYRMPMIFHNIATLSTLLLEILIPASILFGRKGRIIAFSASAILSLFIQLNGNFGFFNLLTACLGIWCLDDYLFYNRPKIVSKIIRPKILGFSESLMIIFSLSIFLLNVFYCILQLSKEAKHPMNIVNYYFSNKRVNDANNPVTKGFLLYGQAISRFRIVSPHGVFKSIGKERQQIQIHLQGESENWEPLYFVKGKSLDKLHFFAPFMNHLPMKFNAHWAYRTDFSFYLNIHPNTSYIKSYKEKLISKLFQDKNDIKSLIDHDCAEEVKIIRVSRIMLYVDNKAQNPFFYNHPKNSILDTICFEKGQPINFAQFDRDPRLIRD